MRSQLSELATIGQAILRQAELHPNAPAVVTTGFEPFSYRELRDYLLPSQRVCITLDFDRETRIAVALPKLPVGHLECDRDAGLTVGSSVMQTRCDATKVIPQSR